MENLNNYMDSSSNNKDDDYYKEDYDAYDYYKKALDKSRQVKSVESMLERWMKGDTRVSIQKAWDEYLDSDHVVVSDDMAKRLLKIAPELVADDEGNYCGSPEVRVTFNKDGPNVVLVVQIGIHKLQPHKTKIKPDDIYVDLFMEFALSSLDDDTFDLAKRMYTTIPRPPKYTKYPSSDPYEAATEHAFNAASNIIVNGSFLGHDTLCLKDPTPGAVVRVKNARVAFVSGVENTSTERVVARADEVGLTIKNYKDNKNVTYYLGFFDHKIKPVKGSFCGFEMNPYSRVLRASGRVLSIEHFDSASGGGFRFVYFRKDVRVGHEFYRNPGYFRYKTRLTVPFFSASNRNYEKCVTDQYLFYSSDPFLDCFTNVNKSGYRKEAFPVGLVPLYAFDTIEETPFLYCGKTVSVPVMYQGIIPVDIKLSLSYHSRMRLLEMVLEASGRQLQDRTGCKYEKLEHPISGDVYDMKHEGYTCELMHESVKCTNDEGFPTDVLVFATKYRVGGDIYPLTKRDAFVYNGDGTFKHYRVYASLGGGYYTVVKGYVPGCPVGFNCAGESPVPKEKRKYYSCVMNVRNALVWTEELVNWYHNLMFCTTRGYLPDRGVFGADVPFVKIGQGVNFQAPNDLDED